MGKPNENARCNFPIHCKLTVIDLKYERRKAPQQANVFLRHYTHRHQLLQMVRICRINARDDTALTGLKVS